MEFFIVLLLFECMASAQIIPTDSEMENNIYSFDKLNTDQVRRFKLQYKCVTQWTPASASVTSGKRLCIRMKVFAVLMGLVVLACSQREDVETLKDQVMTALTTVLMQMDYNLDQASTIARSIVDDKHAWNYLMEESSYLGSSFLSPLNVKEMLEEVLPDDVDNILLYGNRTQSQNAKEEDDDDENDDD